jgi:hypothetical protein
MDKFWNSPKTPPTEPGQYLTTRRFKKSLGGGMSYAVEPFSTEFEPETWQEDMPLLAWAHIPEFKEEEK